MTVSPQSPSPGTAAGADCGTRRGYERHVRYGEETCGPCRAANNEYARAWYAAHHPPRLLQPCGTPAAHLRHKRAGEVPCEPCRLARNADLAERRAAAKRRRERRAATSVALAGRLGPAQGP